MVPEEIVEAGGHHRTVSEEYCLVLYDLVVGIAHFQKMIWLPSLLKISAESSEFGHYRR